MAPKKKHFIEAAPFGRLDEMIAKDDGLGECLGRHCHPSQKPGGLGGSASQPKSKKQIKNFSFLF